jgi:hypothetical protein
MCGRYLHRHKFPSAESYAGKILTERMITPKLVLLMFSVLEWLLAWSLRFIPLPQRNRTGITLRSFGPVVFSVMIAGGFVAEISSYAALAGNRPLKGDHFVFVAVIVECLIAFVIVLKSESVLRLRQREDAARK